MVKKMTAEPKICIQMRVWAFIKRVYFIEVLFSLGTSYVFSFPFRIFHSSDGHFISAESIEPFLHSLLDVCIATFGFVGLIMVFVFGSLLNNKRELEKSSIEIGLKGLESRQTYQSQIKSEHEMKTYETLANEYARISREIIEKIEITKTKIKRAVRHGFLSLAFSVGSIVGNLNAFGALTDKGLHFLNITGLFFTFIATFAFTIRTITSILELEGE